MREELFAELLKNGRRVVPSFNVQGLLRAADAQVARLWLDNALPKKGLS